MLEGLSLPAERACTGDERSQGSGRKLREQNLDPTKLLNFSAINAAVFLGEPGIDPCSLEYERLVDLVL